LATTPPPGAARFSPIILLPAAAAGAAFLLHHFLADRAGQVSTWLDSLPAWQHPYPLLLSALAALWLVLAGLQGAWLPLRCWAEFNAPRWAGAIGIMAFWQFVTDKMDWMALPYFPGPDSVFGSIFEERDILVKCTWYSLKLLLSGYATGVAAGLMSGILIGWFPLACYWGMPALKVVGPLPATALIPLVMAMSKESFLPATALIAFAVWFPVTMLTSSGISSVRQSYLDVARTLGAGRWYLISRVAFPAALPHIFIGLFMGLGASFLTLIVAETVGVPAGLGWYIKWRQGFGMEYAKVYGVLIIMAGFFSGLMTLLFKARDRVLKWQTGLIKW
jgi:NitT/TauT family transport system permease protein